MAAANDNRSQNPNTAPRQQRSEPKKPRIGIVTAIFMIAVAALFDLTQFLFTFFHLIPVVGNAFSIVMVWFLGMVASISFGIWFLLHGVSYFGKNSGQKLAIVFGVSVVELIPILDALPAITGGVIGMILTTRMEDTGKGISLVDIATVASLAIPGVGEVAAGARAAQVAAKGAQAGAAAAKTGGAAAKTASKRAVREPDFGPGVPKAPKQIDINTPYKRAPERVSFQDFAQPYVPEPAANDNEEQAEEGKWAA